MVPVIDGLVSLCVHGRGELVTNQGLEKGHMLDDSVICSVAEELLLAAASYSGVQEWGREVRISTPCMREVFRRSFTPNGHHIKA